MFQRDAHLQIGRSDAACLLRWHAKRHFQSCHTNATRAKLRTKCPSGKVLLACSSSGDLRRARSQSGASRRFVPKSLSDGSIDNNLSDNDSHFHDDHVLNESEALNGGDGTSAFAGDGNAASSLHPPAILIPRNGNMRHPRRGPQENATKSLAPVAVTQPSPTADIGSFVPAGNVPTSAIDTPSPSLNPSPFTPPALVTPPEPESHRRLHREHPQLRYVMRPLPRVLFVHTGGTLGMDPEEAFEEDESHNLRVRAGATETSYKSQLRPGEMLSNLLGMVPELDKFANVDLQVLFNKDSSRVGPSDWVAIAKALHHNRARYDAFIVVHGTDTMSYTAAALSLMLCGFGKPIVMTGSQLPLSAPRTDARQNLLDSIQVATSAFSPPHVALQEVAVCFGGKLMRGNRSQKVSSSAYQAFDSLTYPYLATLGIDVDWNTRVLLRVEGAYSPRFKLDPRVIRIPVVPGSDPRYAYGDLYGRGVRGVVLEAFGVGNLPDLAGFGWLPWLKDQTAKGLKVCLTSQCSSGPLQPGLYRAGQLAAQMGVTAGPHMTPECATVKMMFCLKHPDLALGAPLAGEL